MNNVQGKTTEPCYVLEKKERIQTSRQQVMYPFRGKLISRVNFFGVLLKWLPTNSVSKVNSQKRIKYDGHHVIKENVIGCGHLQVCDGMMKELWNEVIK